MNNSDILANLESQSVHQNFDQIGEIKTLVIFFTKLCSKMYLIKTAAACSDVDVADAAPKKQHLYMASPLKL